MDEKNLPEGWTIEPFTNCIERTVASNKLKIQQKDFKEKGKYPIIDQSVKYIAGYTDDSKRIYKGNLPVIIFGDHTRIFKFVDFPFALGADGVVVLNPKQSKLLPKYFYFFLKGLTIESHGYSRHRKFLKRKKVVIPPKEIQAKIIEILEKSERLKEWRKESNKLTRDYLDSVFFQIFGNPYTNDKKFEIRGFLDIFNTSVGKLDSNAAQKNGQFPFFTCSQETFRINSYSFDCEAILLSGNNAAGVFSAKYYKGKFDAYQRTYVLTLKDANNSYRYFQFLLEKKLVELRSRSIGTNTKYLTLGIMKTIDLMIPPTDLQRKFSRVVENVEHLKEYEEKSEQEIDDLCNVLMKKAFGGELNC